MLWSRLFVPKRRCSSGRGGGWGCLLAESIKSPLLLHNMKPSKICEANYSSVTGAAPWGRTLVWRRWKLAYLGKQTGYASVQRMCVLWWSSPPSKTMKPSVTWAPMDWKWTVLSPCLCTGREMLGAAGKSYRPKSSCKILSWRRVTCKTSPLHSILKTFQSW